MKNPPRKLADDRYVIEIVVDGEIDYALVEVNPFTQIVLCGYCHRETCEHARDVRNHLRGTGEYE